LETLKFIHDCIHKNNPTQFHDYFKYTDTNQNTANFRESKLYTPMVRTTTYGLKSLKYDGAVIWNNVPLFIRTVSSRKPFANKLKKLFVSSYSSE